MNRVAIIQSNYVPWRGFFDLVSRCDSFVIYDSVQYAKRHWHNRNKLRTPAGTAWITIPVATKSQFEQPIHDVEISGPWAEKHWQTLRFNYSRAPHYERLAGDLERLYAQAETMRRLTEVNELFFRAICGWLGLGAAIIRDTQLTSHGKKTERLLSMCKELNATHYLSGPSAKSYLDESLFATQGIAVEWMDYSGYPPYRQCWPGFEPEVSMLDVLLNAGPDARHLLQREGPPP
jgi:WbqC-like protein family